jgi:hypothetical protein
MNSIFSNFSLRSPDASKYRERSLSAGPAYRLSGYSKNHQPAGFECYDGCQAAKLRATSLSLAEVEVPRRIAAGETARPFSRQSTVTHVRQGRAAVTHGVLANSTLTIKGQSSPGYLSGSELGYVVLCDFSY